MQSGKPRAVLGGKYVTFHCPVTCLRDQRVTNRANTEPNQNELTQQFIRISVGTPANAPRFGRPKVGTFPPQLKSNAVEYESHKPHSVGRRSSGILWFVGSWASGPRVSSLPRSRPEEIHVDQIHKTQKKWNGAGTFGLLLTLKKHERCEKRRRRIARIELAHRL